MDQTSTVDSRWNLLEHSFYSVEQGTLRAMSCATTSAVRACRARCSGLARAGEWGTQ